MSALKISVYLLIVLAILHLNIGIIVDRQECLQSLTTHLGNTVQ